jgi:hypothetical protein
MNNGVTSQNLYDEGLLQNAFEEGYLNTLASIYSSLTEAIKDDFDYIDGIWREKSCIGS